MTTYLALRDVLKQYQDILTIFTPTTRKPGAVMAIVSGNRARELMAGEATRYAGMDGRLPDLSSDASTSLIPLISDSWSNNFTWRGEGSIPPEERQKLRQIVSAAHAQGRQARLYATPGTLPIWHELLDADINLINTDDLAGLQQFLLREDPLLKGKPRK